MNFDVAVVGGGVVGATVACGLGRAGLRVALLEARPRVEAPRGTEFDLRVSAITPASARILERLEVWPRLARERLGLFREMRVWDGSGEVHFDAADVGLPALGFIVENRALLAALEAVLETLDTVRSFRGAGLEDLRRDGGGVHLRAGAARLRARVAVGADGARSRVRDLAGIEVDSGDYGQRALVGSLRLARGHQETAWQRFLPTGPVAFLPLPGDLASLVWSTTPERAGALESMTGGAFASALEVAVEGRLGALETVGERASFPLGWVHARRYAAERVVLVGDAAHRVHPLAGQGLNLGLLDAATLVEVILGVHGRGRDPGRLANLRPYERWRRGPDRLMLEVLGGFKHLFGSERATVRGLRNLGLAFTDRLTPLKRLFMRHATGLSGDLPELARIPMVDPGPSTGPQPSSRREPPA